MGFLLPGRVLDRDKDGDTQPGAQPASQRRLWEQRGQCVWPAIPCSHLGKLLCFPAAAHLLAELLDMMLHQGRSVATIATGLPWFSTFPSRNYTHFSQICCCLRDVGKNLWPGRREGLICPWERYPGWGSAVPCQVRALVLSPENSSTGSRHSHLHQPESPQSPELHPKPWLSPSSTSRVGSTAYLHQQPGSHKRNEEERVRAKHPNISGVSSNL